MQYAENIYMIRSKELIGSKITNSDGKVLGIIKGLDYEHNEKNVKGFYVEKTGITRKKVYLPYANVVKLGDKSVSIDDEEVLKRKSFPFTSYDISYVFNKTDVEVGYISDFFINEKSGDILGLEVSKGPYDDISYGRSFYANYTPINDKGDIKIDKQMKGVNKNEKSTILHGNDGR